MRAENTTFRSDRDLAGGAAALAHLVRRVAIAEPTRGRERLVYPVPSHRSFFLPPPVPAPHTPAARSVRAEFCEDILDVLALGVGDYFEKTRAFKTIGVALSGGRDSLLCLIVARRYLDRKHEALSSAERDARAAEVLRAFFMPTRFTSPETRVAAEVAAAELGAPLVTSDIEDAFARELAASPRTARPVTVDKGHLGPYLGDMEPSRHSLPAQASLRRPILRRRAPSVWRSTYSITSHAPSSSCPEATQRGAPRPSSARSTRPSTSS